MCLGHWTTLYPPAAPYIEWDTPTLSPHAMRTAAGFAGRAAARISQDEVALDTLFRSAPDRTGFSFIFCWPFCCLLQLSLALVVCQLWDRVTGTWICEWESGPGMPDWCCGDVLAGHVQSCLLCSVLLEELSLALLALIRSSHFMGFFTSCNIFF